MKKGIKITGGIVGGLIVIGAIASAASSNGTPPAPASSHAAPATSAPATADAKASPSASADPMAGVYSDVCSLFGDGTSEAQVVSIVKQQAGPGGVGGMSATQIVRTAEKQDCPQYVQTGPVLTASQEQAVEAAKGYLSMGSGFSREGLLNQLTSSEGDGFSEADASFAVKYLHPDWNAQAVESAKSYMQMGGFSHSSLYDQLTSSEGEGFTSSQAEYALSQVGL